MDLNILFESTKTNLFTDLVLTLTDEVDNDITLNVHKVILHAANIYFRKLLTNCKEKVSNKITITVPNALVTNDIIIEFYGQPIDKKKLLEWSYLFAYYQCRDFLGLNLDKKLLKDLVFPIEGFDLLCEVVDLIGYDNDTIELIINNMPDDYDLSKFTKEQLKRIIAVIPKYNLIAGYDDDHIEIWNTVTNKSICLENHAKTICYSPDGTYFATGGEYNGITIWDNNTNVLIKRIGLDFNCQVVNICFSPNGKYLAGNVWDHHIKIWVTDTWELVKTMISDVKFRILTMCCSPNSEHIVCGRKNHIEIWDIATEQLINILTGHTDRIHSICYSPDGKYIASGSDDYDIRIWNSITGESIKILSGHTLYVRSVNYSPDGKYIVNGSSDARVNIWDSETGCLIKTIKQYFQQDSVCYSPDGKYIANGNGNNINIWDSETYQLINTLIGTADSVSSICYSSNTNSSELLKRMELQLKKID